MKVVIDVNIRGIDRLVLCDNKVLQQPTQAAFLYAPEKTLRGRRIISKHEDIHCSQRSPCRTTGPNQAGFFSVTSMTRFGT